MQLNAFRDLLVTADPAITKYEGAGTGNYSVWFDGLHTGLDADGVEVESKIICYVDRFTTTDPDSIAVALDAALRSSDELAVKEYIVMYEPETGYIHHSWTVEVT